jgi:hypothetical protein
MTYMTNFGFGTYIFWIPVDSLQPQSKGDAVLLSFNDKQRSEYHSQTLTSFRISGSSQQSISTKNPDAALSLSSSADTPKLPSKILRVVPQRVLPLSPHRPHMQEPKHQPTSPYIPSPNSPALHSHGPKPIYQIVNFTKGQSVVFGLPWTRSNLSQPVPRQTRLHLHREC